MANTTNYGVNEMVEGLEQSRATFLKHVRGVTEEQMDWKPYPECKSIRETLQHLVADDLIGIDTMQKEGEPDYDAYQCHMTDTAALMSEMAAKRKELIETARASWAGRGPLDQVILWGMPMTLAQAIAALQGEDAYHTGQIAFIRMAIDPSWDYYKEVNS